jgi:hypothetical protein
MSGSKLFDDSSRAAAAEAGRNEQPLGLTVHSLPEPAQVAAADARRDVHGRWKLLAVLLVSIAPVLASYLTYYVIRPEGRRNFGELIDPPRALPDQTGISLDGKPSNLRALQGQWLLVAVGSGQCAADCVQQLYLQRQLRESLGKEKDKLDRVWLVSDEQPVPTALLPGLKEATVLRVPQSAVSQWLAPAGGQQLADHLYLVDPMGNWMMRFPAHLDVAGAGKAKKDIERLLRAAASWDQPGR